MLPTVIGPYHIARLLGSGGMGTVYEGVHQVIGRRAAIKIIHPKYAFDEDMTRRFFAEARASGTIDHPGIVQIFEVGQESQTGSPYLVMELLRGESFARYLK